MVCAIRVFVGFMGFWVCLGCSSGHLRRVAGKNSTRLGASPIIYGCKRDACKALMQMGVPDPHTHTAQKLVELLSTARRQRGWSQETWAVEAKVSPSCIQHLEHGRSTPTLITLLKLARAVDMDLPDLLRTAITETVAKGPKGRR